MLKFLWVMSLCLSLQAVEPTDREVIAATILGEGRSSEGEMYGVSCVIAQRASERHISPRDVCLQKSQFTANRNGPQLHLLNGQGSKYALALADKIGSLDLNFVGHANHFHSGPKPYWASGLTPTKTIGRLYFYRL